MKFSAGVITAVMAATSMGGAFAFAPQVNGASSTSLSSTASKTPTYTFTKSEEIFAEALTVRTNETNN